MKPILTWGALHEIYLKLNECPGFVETHLNLKDMHRFDNNFHDLVFWENLILLAAEGLSDKD
jgi:hypothetical protein